MAEATPSPPLSSRFGTGWMVIALLATALVANKRRAMELQAGQPQKKGNTRGPVYTHNVEALRDQEMEEVARRAEQAYEQFVAQWETRPKKVRGRSKSAGL